MYLLDLFKNVFKPHRIGALFYIIVNVALMYVIVGVTPVINLLWIVLAYGFSLAIALSPVGEFLFRISVRAWKIKRPDYIQRLQPLMDSVYDKAKKQSSFLNQKITLYMTKDSNPNAFALGRQTIAVTSGLLELNDEEICAILAHEFGHIINRDTVFLQLIFVGNIFLFPITFFYNIIAILLGSVFGGQFLGKIVFHLIRLPITIWNWIGRLLILLGSRKDEFGADNYAVQLGLGNNLASALDKLSYNSKDPGPLALLASTHPRTDKRIEKILNATGEYSA